MTGTGVFMLVWWGQLLSLLGSGLTGFVLGVWVYQQTGTVTQFGLLSFFFFLPGLLIYPLAGALVDRLDRRVLLALGDLADGAVALGVAVLSWQGVLQVPMVYAAAAASSLMNAFRWPALLALNAQLVPREHLGRTNGLLQMALVLPVAVGPLAGGLLLARWPLHAALVVQALGCFVALALLLCARLPRYKAPVDAASLAESLAAAWRFVAARPGLMGLLVFLPLVQLQLSSAQILFTPLVLSTGSPQALGLVLGTAGGGILAGGLLMAFWGGPARKIDGLLGAVALLGLLLAGGGLCTSLSAFAACAFFVLCCVPVVYGCVEAIWQRKVPLDLQGRVTAFRYMTVTAAVPLAAVLAGPLADRVFVPLLQPGGPLVGSLGPLLGVGPARGIGLFLVLLGLVLVALAAVASRYRPLVRAETDLPEWQEPGVAAAPCPSEPGERVPVEAM